MSISPSNGRLRSTAFKACASLVAVTLAAGTATAPTAPVHFSSN